MSHYIKLLNDGVHADRERQAAETILKHSDDAQAARERLTPLVDRLRTLLATIPAEVQREGLSLPAIQARLKGRRGRGCHTGELGTALRRLGWTRQRGWGAGAGDGFGASWFPPGSA